MEEMDIKQVIDSLLEYCMTKKIICICIINDISTGKTDIGSNVDPETSIDVLRSAIDNLMEDQ